MHCATALLQGITVHMVRRKGSDTTAEAVAGGFTDFTRAREETHVSIVSNVTHKSLTESPRNS